MSGEEHFPKLSFPNTLTKLKAIEYLRSLDVLDDLMMRLLLVSRFILA